MTSFIDLKKFLIEILNRDWENMSNDQINKCIEDLESVVESIKRRLNFYKKNLK